MRKHDSIAPLLIISLLAAAAATMPLAGPGCATQFENPDGPYGGDALLYRVEEKVPAAFAIVDAFLLFEHENRATLPPDVREIAVEVEAKAKAAFAAMNQARDEYVAAKASFRAAKEQSAIESAAMALDAKQAELKRNLDVTVWAVELVTPLIARFAIPVKAPPAT